MRRTSAGLEQGRDLVRIAAHWVIRQTRAFDQFVIGVDARAGVGDQRRPIAQHQLDAVILQDVDLPDFQEHRDRWQFIDGCLQIRAGGDGGARA